MNTYMTLFRNFGKGFLFSKRKGCAMIYINMKIKVDAAYGR